MAICEKHGPYSTLCRACDLDLIDEHGINQVTQSAVDSRQVNRNNYVDGKLSNYQEDKEPSPPSMYFKHAGHHWIAKVDADQRLYSYRVLQWGPKAMKWYNSDGVGTCEEPVINLKGAVWLGAVEQPELPWALPGR